MKGIYCRFIRSRVKAAWRKPKWVRPIDRVVADIRVEVIPAAESAERIGLDVAAQLRRVVAEAIVVPAAFEVEVLPRESQVLCDRAADGCLSERIVACLPCNCLIAVGG
jgi:hypothetical protein